ncbi:MAG: hypothetical protein KBS82_07790 [Oscillospiraceae bacterium]|nr:hypothetical protein [Candidatus Limimonas egerieequi]
MKKNTIMRIAAVVLMCTLVTACFASSTFAKYTSQAEGTGTATVAKWAFEVNGNNIVTESQSNKETVTFNLFDTAALDTKDGAAETDVVTGKIAPGTKGSFDFTVQNTSEVRAEYTIALTKDLKDVPIKFYSDAAMTKEITDFTKVASGNLDAGMTAAINTATIYWQWAYGPDVNDNALGINTPEISVTATIVATQID